MKIRILYTNKAYENLYVYRLETVSLEFLKEGWILFPTSPLLSVEIPSALETVQEMILAKCNLFNLQYLYLMAF